MTIKEMQDRKRELGFTNEMIAERAGVPLGTVQKLFAGFTKAPRRKTIEALERVLCPEESLARPLLLREEAAAYGADPKEGHYTIEDYYALPDERRVELIDGYFYDMAAPTQIHQTILGQLHLQFGACMSKHRECRLFMAPLDVRLDQDNYTMVQPDLLVVCRKHDGDIRRLNGAPDLALEILSPSSRYHDMFRKLNKYKSANVREYWIVDPEKKRITVYDFEHDELPESYSFQDRIPVRISGGQCVIDFIKISEVLRQYGLETWHKRKE